jgi:hypothetical protein
MKKKEFKEWEVRKREMGRVRVGMAWELRRGM